MDPRYYADLLVNGVEQSQELSPTSSEPPIHVDRSTTKSSQGRSKNFREDEDKLLVSAWLNVSMDHMNLRLKVVALKVGLFEK
jgi:hypothetical protein